jgi:site-specific recombinase XerD
MATAAPDRSTGPGAFVLLPERLGHLRKLFLDFIRVECGLSANTIEAYQRDLDDLLVELARSGVSEPDAITPRQLSEHLARLKTDRGLVATSIIRHMATVRIFCRWLQARGFTEANPAELLERPMRWQKLPGVLSPREMKAILAAPRPPCPARPPLPRQFRRQFRRRAGRPARQRPLAARPRHARTDVRLRPAGQ